MYCHGDAVVFMHRSKLGVEQTGQAYTSRTEGVHNTLTYVSMLINQLVRTVVSEVVTITGLLQTRHENLERC